MEGSDSLQIATGGDLNLYSLLIDPLEVYNFPWTTQDEHNQQATKLAQDVLVPRFVAQLTDFIESCSGRTDALPVMMKINRWMTETMAQVYDEQQPQGLYTDLEEALRAFVMVKLIRVPDVTYAPEKIPSSGSVFLGPSSYVIPYMSQDSIVLAVSRCQWIEATEHSIDTLFFLHLKMEQSGASSSFESCAAVERTLPKDRHAMDVRGDDLRIATTLQKWNTQDNVWMTCGDSVFYDDCMMQSKWDVLMWPSVVAMSSRLDVLMHLHVLTKKEQRKTNPRPTIALLSLTLANRAP